MKTLPQATTIELARAGASQKIGLGQSATDFLIPGVAKPTARKASSIGDALLFTAHLASLYWQVVVTVAL
ncbi:hypothetical protein J5226_10080 [Lysobacter sp. K5869]|uniref:hypothetical protein n=1 Tax=Lysobacter sp. K5869 TaxID=2820808 RepID=UPI001C05FAF6|nr:hypothetical protein [Lysobacter sp. K5869]QWP78711.1 hypothetical protein J5226_10080 [Lysobacter sp. K5869]